MKTSPTVHREDIPVVAIRPEDYFLLRLTQLSDKGQHPVSTDMLSKEINLSHHEIISVLTKLQKHKRIHRLTDGRWRLLNNGKVRSGILRIILASQLPRCSEAVRFSFLPGAF